MFHRHVAQWLSLSLTLFAGVWLARTDARAINLSVNRPDVARALALARWPHTNAERVRFHDRYLTPVDTRISPLTMKPAVAQVEVVTELRRVELLAEEHERVNDSFGRGGLDEVEAALKPWRGLVAVDAQLWLPGCPRHCWIPPTDITIEGVGTARAGLAAPAAFYMRSDASPLAFNIAVEATFDAASVGQQTRMVSVVVDGRELGRVAIDFAALE